MPPRRALAQQGQIGDSDNDSNQPQDDEVPSENIFLFWPNIIGRPDEPSFCLFIANKYII
jgi:hypothetical protein